MSDGWRIVRSDGRYYVKSDLEGAYFGDCEDAEPMMLGGVAA